MIEPTTGEKRQLKSLSKILVYGDVKTKKTWWALRAALAGFNVTLLDGDNGHHIIAKLPAEAKKKIAYISLVDSPDDSRFHAFLARMYKNKAWAINEDTRESIFAGSADMYKPEAAHVYFDPTKLNANDVLIVDSWSAFCRSMAKHWNITNGTNKLATGNQGKNDIAKRDIGRQEWEDYGWGKNVSLTVLGMLQQLPCHVVVIAHSMEHVVMEKVDDAGAGKAKERIKSSTIQPIGYSGPQGKLLGQFFSDILFMHIDKFDDYKISTKPLFDTVGGSRILDPKIYKWSDLTWNKYIELAGGLYELPDTGSEYYNSEAFEFLAAGELPKFLTKEKTKSRKVLDDAADAKLTRVERMRIKSKI